MHPKLPHVDTGATVSVDITLAVPEQLAREATRALKARKPWSGCSARRSAAAAWASCFDAADRLAALTDPPLTDAEVLAEIQAARAERQAHHAAGP